jgi:23S rRNA pseudouridine955/2504/2580 synthase
MPLSVLFHDYMRCAMSKEMSKEEFIISVDEAGSRLDKYLRSKIDGLSQGAIEKYLRKGDIRVGGAKQKSNYRLEQGDIVQVSGFLRNIANAPAPKRKPTLSADERKFIRSLVIEEGKDYWILNKPQGLAVQGGSKTTNHIDRLLPGLVEEGEPTPKLVHRLDKDTSGVLLIAKTGKAAQALGKEFANKNVEKTYWALVVGLPDLSEGRIDMPLAKLEDVDGEKVQVDYDEGQRAVTYYRVIEALGNKLSWLELLPSTGRTHQLRVHCTEALRTPIVGDGKYGGADAFPFGRVPMHLHARGLSFTAPSGKKVSVIAPLPPHMMTTWKEFGLEQDASPRE